MQICGTFIAASSWLLKFSYISQKTSKCGKTTSDTLAYRLVCHFLFLPDFDVNSDLLLTSITQLVD